jgi:hypothetical protein
MHLSRRPTPFEFALVFYFIALLLIGFGIASLIAAHRAPPEKAEIAAAVELRAWWSLGLGTGIGFLFWLFRRLTD